MVIDFEKLKKIVDGNENLARITRKSLWAVWKWRVRQSIPPDAVVLICNYLVEKKIPICSVFKFNDKKPNDQNPPPQQK